MNIITRATCILASATMLAGCARFSTHQVQYDTFSPEGEIASRRTETKAYSFTFFDSKSALSSFKATQTDKSQSAIVGSLNQEASGSNTVALVEMAVGAAVRAAVRAAIPVPTPPVPGQ